MGLRQVFPVQTKRICILSTPFQKLKIQFILPYKNENYKEEEQ